MKQKYQYKLPFEAEQWFLGQENPDVKGENCHCEMKEPHVHNEDYSIKVEPGDWIVYYDGKIVGIYLNKTFCNYYKKIEQ